ncbi:MAG: pilus assembly protein N-terminal domain-containing protein [Planctomycetes bacterium]|nr:pilus assembly protein N-terminal domain-containing protein [Planctomycetota bacterium]
MMPKSNASPPRQRTWGSLCVLGVAAACVCITSAGFAFSDPEQPGAPPTSVPLPEPLISGFQPHLPVVPQKLSAPRERSGKNTSFVDSISRNDAMFEVVLGQGRMLLLKEDLAEPEAGGKSGQALIAVGNPGVADFEILGTRQIRVVGKKIGTTDLVVTTANQKTISFEVHVVYDLQLLQVRVQELFPDAHVRIAQLGQNLVVEGQARDAVQIRNIVQLVRQGVISELPQTTGSTSGGAAGNAGSPSSSPLDVTAAAGSGTGESQGPEVINLLRVPGPQQVMLKVQIAELNRTAMRQLGADFLFTPGGNIFGTRLTGVTTGTSTATNGGLLGSITTAATSGSPTTVFGIFHSSGVQGMISALRENSLLKILAEPNLVAMNGHEARFLAGGEFPVPVPQSGAGGGPATITVQYKKFGVQLAFVPFILDGDTIRLTVDPEVSSVDFALGIELSGTRVPGLNTRNAHTVVEMREGQTLAMAGLMQVAISNETKRIPGLGDLPYIGPFFSNNTGQRLEKELVVLVTPFLVEAMNPEEVPPRPGDEVLEPNDLEFYLLGRLQGRTGDVTVRSTTNSDDPLGFVQRMKLECRNIQGPSGYTE